jgi:hypothetical protein
MTQNIDYEKLYFELVTELGYNPKTVMDDNLQEKSIQAAKILRRVAVTMQTQTPEKTGALFLCGLGGERDSYGLPEYIEICPTYGMQGVAMYKKFREYSEPGW